MNEIMSEIKKAVIVALAQEYGASKVRFWFYTWIALGVILPMIVGMIIMDNKGSSKLKGMHLGMKWSWIGVLVACWSRDFKKWKANLHAEIIYEGLATHILGSEGIKGIEGKLHLTKDAVIFLSFVDDDDEDETVKPIGDETVIPIENISAVSPGHTLGLIPNRFSICTKGGEKETFLVSFHGGKWISQITEQMELAKTFSCTHANAKVTKKKVETKIAKRSEVNCSQSAPEKNNKCLRADRIRQDCRPAGGVGCQTVKYYYSNGRDQKGPVTLAELKVVKGLSPATLVWNAGLVSWTRAGDIPELSAVFASVASPVPPPVTVTRHHRDV
jgi:hypothetical protein